MRRHHNVLQTQLGTVHLACTDMVRQQYVKHINIQTQHFINSVWPTQQLTAAPLEHALPVLPVILTAPVTAVVTLEVILVLTRELIPEHTKG